MTAWCFVEPPTVGTKYAFTPEIGQGLLFNAGPHADRCVENIPNARAPKSNKFVTFSIIYVSVRARRNRAAAAGMLVPKYIRSV